MKELIFIEFHEVVWILNLVEVVKASLEKNSSEVYL